MTEIDTFINQAREKGLDDNKIRQLLIDQGWSVSQVESGLLGLTVPAVPATTIQSAQEEKSLVKRATISSLEAALQHIFLWVFTLTSTIMISIVSAIAFGGSSTDRSSEPLLTYLVLETVTFLPFIILFIHYLRKFKKDNELTTGRIWSIITIVIHSLGAMGSIITFLLAIILVPTDNGGRFPVLIASGAIAIMNIGVLGAYIIANFTKRASFPTRDKLLYSFPVLLFAIILIFGIMAVVNVGPLRADDQTRKDLVDTVKAIKTYTNDNKKLPTNLTSVDGAKSGITYSKKSTTDYSLCANFQVSSRQNSYYSSVTITDDYVYEYDFSSTKAGQNCFTITANYLVKSYPYDDYSNGVNIQKYETN
jgi:hypothetical protein